MKNKILFLMLLLPLTLSLKSQNGNSILQNEYEFNLSLISSNKKPVKANKKINTVKNISLFGDYDFENEPYYIIYLKNQKDTSFYYIDEKKDLLKLQAEYNLTQPIFDSPYNCDSDRGEIFVFCDKKWVGSFATKWNCGEINTEVEYLNLTQQAF